MPGINVSKAQRDFMDRDRDRATREQRVFENQATPQNAARIGQFSAEYPGASSPLGIGLALSGVPVTDPIVQDVVNAEQTSRTTQGPQDSSGGGVWDSLSRGLGEFVYDPIKGTVRWGMMGLMSVYESTVGGSGIRAAQQSAQDPNMGFGDALYEQQPFLTRGLGDVFRDPGATWDSMWAEATTRDSEQQAMMEAGNMQQTANTGSGWFVNSTVDPEVVKQVEEQSAQLQASLDGQQLSPNERYKQELTAAPQIWSDAVETSQYQQALGGAMTQQGYADREGVMFNVPKIGGNGTGNYTPWSPGRFAAATVFEPGTTAFSRASGVGDIASQIFLDPMNLTAGLWAKAGVKGRTIKSVMKKVSGHADDIVNPTAGIRATTVAPDNSTAKFRGLLEGERNPVLAFGGEAIDEAQIPQLRAAVGDNPAYNAMLDEGLWFNDPNGHLAFRDMKAKVEATGAAFDDISQVSLVDGLADESMNLLDDMRIKMIDDEPIAGAWAVPDPNGAQRRLHPKDPPEWIADDVRAGGQMPETIQGRPAQEFLDDHEDFYLAGGVIDDLNSVDATNRLGQTRPFRRVRKTRGYTDNAMVRVYGKTLNLGDGKALPSDIADDLAGAMKESGAYSDITGWAAFDDPTLNNFPHKLSEMLRGHGYGKIKWGDSWLVLDDFVGGSKSDALGRVFFKNGDHSLMYGKSTATGATNVTPNQMNQNIDRLQELGRYALDDAGNIDPARMSRAAVDEFKAKYGDEAGRMRQSVADADNPGHLLPGDRPDVEPGFELSLEGKKANLFVEDLNRIAHGDDAAGKLDDVLAKLDRQGQNVPASVRQAILDSDTVDDTRKIVANWMGGKTGPQQITLAGGTRYGRLRTIDNIIRGPASGRKARGSVSELSWLSRRTSAMMPSEPINLLDRPEEAYSTITKILPQYNLKRGSEAIKYVGTDGVTHITTDIETVMEGFRRLQPGDRETAAKLTSLLTENLFASLVTGPTGKIARAPRAIPQSLAAEAVKWMDDTEKMVFFDHDRLAQIKLGSATGSNMRLAGEAKHMPGVNAVTEAWNGSISFPEPQMVKRVANYSDRIGQLGNFVAAKKMVKLEDGSLVKARKAAKAQAKERGKKLKRMKGYTLKDAMSEVGSEAMDWELHSRTSYLFANAVMTKLWKPLVLLRGAWTLRILIDDQMRMSAEGYNTMFRHPIRFINYAMGQGEGFKAGIKGGFLDINGKRIKLGNLDEVAHSDIVAKASMSMPDGEIGRGAYGARHTKAFKKGTEGYSEGVSRHLHQYSTDPTARVLAGSTSDDPVVDGVEYLLGRRPDLEKKLGVTGQKARKDLSFTQAGDDELLRLIDEGDEDTLKALVTQRNNELNYWTGGDVVLDDSNGKWLSYDDNGDDTLRIGNAPDIRDDSDEAIGHVLRRGDSDILAIIADGKGAIDNPLIKANGTLSTRGSEDLNKLIQTKIEGEGGAFFPSKSYGPDLEAAASAGEDTVKVMDRAVRTFYEYLMTKPSDYLSRNPLFGQAYWRSMGERLPYMSDEVRDAVLAQAKTAGFERDVLRARKNGAGWMTKADVDEAKGIVSVDPGDSLDSVLDALDEHAKAGGLAQVERTLFDMANKKNISDSLSLIFPFVEAWGEFATRWSRLLVTGDRAAVNANRFQQGINGLRESNPFNPEGNEGFFHTNEFGDEVFSYPAALTKAQIGVHNVMTKIPGLSRFIGGEIDGATADSIKATGSLESMNFAAGIIPGFGPAFQLGARTVMDDNPKWDGIKNIIAPFGMEGGAASFAPAWMKRVMAAQGSNDPQLNAEYMRTVQDVIRTMMNNGKFDNAHTVPDFNALVEIAEEQARGLMMVRAANTWWAPSSPTYTLQAEDKNGEMFAYNALGNEYRDILYDEAGGNHTDAFDTFTKRFGNLTPALSQTSRTYAIRERSVTNEGYRFQRNNPEFFDAYPETAMYLEPTIGRDDDDFNYQQWIAQLREGVRVGYTGEQFAAVTDDGIGDMEWEYWHRDNLQLKESNQDAWEAAQMRARADIESRHPYWKQPIAGIGKKISNKQQMAEIEQWLTDPNLRGAPVVEGAREYLGARQHELDRLKAEHGLGTLSGSEQSYAIEARAELRQFAEDITANNPQFGELFNMVFAGEVGKRHDGFSDEPVSFFQDGTDLFDQTLGVPPSAVPAFTNTELGPKFGGSQT